MEPWIEKMRIYDPQAAMNLAGVGASMANSLRVSDQETYDGLFVRIWSEGNVTAGEITSHVGTRLRVEDASTLISYLQQAGGMGDPTADAYKWFNNPLFKAVYNDVEGQFTGTDGLLTGTARENASRAKSELVTNWFNHLGTEAGQKMLMNPDAAQAWLDAYGQAIVRRYGGGAAITQEGTNPMTPSGALPERAGVGVDWTTQAVLSQDELHTMQSGQMTPALESKLAGFGVPMTQHGIITFLQRQSELLAAGLMPEPEEPQMPEPPKMDTLQDQS
jgi:hypothetical protein